MLKVDLKIEGKKGPFFLRKPSTEDTLAFFDADKHKDRSSAEGMRLFVAMTLVNGTGKPVYKRTDMERMERDIGGPTIMWLANKSMDYSEIHKITELGDAVEAAEKN